MLSDHLSVKYLESRNRFASSDFDAPAYSLVSRNSSKAQRTFLNRVVLLESRSIHTVA